MKRLVGGVSQKDRLLGRMLACRNPSEIKRSGFEIQTRQVSLPFAEDPDADERGQEGSGEVDRSAHS
jgi:hypothetical protein